MRHRCREDWFRVMLIESNRISILGRVDCKRYVVIFIFLFLLQLLTNIKQNKGMFQIQV